MAGTCKPDYAGNEGKHNIIDYSLAYNVSYLFNGNNTSTDYKTNSGYWNTAARYLTIELFQTSNIYRSGNSSYTQYNKKLAIYKYNEYSGKYDINVTDKYTIECTQIKNGAWELFVKNIPKGKYKFVPEELYRMDSEWYIEESPIYLLKMNGEYYSVNDEHYNVETQTYNPVEYDYDNLENLVFQRSTLFQDVTIEEETFKPIDKFNKFSFVQICDEDLKVCGSKSNTELIVANGDIDLSMARDVLSFSLVTNRTDDTIIKTVFSTDKGKTWYTYEDDNFIKLNASIPLKDYHYKSEMTEEDVANYESAKAEILEKGITPEVLETIYVTEYLKNYETIRFAYVIQTASGATTEIDTLKWTFNSPGRMYKMNDNEVTVDIYEHSVLVTSLIDTAIMKTNVVF